MTLTLPITFFHFSQTSTATNDLMHPILVFEHLNLATL